MYLIIVFLALCFCQKVSSVTGKYFPSANTSNILFNRDTDPTFAIHSSCNRYPQVRYIVQDWFQTAQETSRRIRLGAQDPRFQYAFKILFGTDIENPRKYKFEQLEDPATAFEFVECK